MQAKRYQLQIITDLKMQIFNSFDTDREAFECLYDDETPVLSAGEYIIFDSEENIEL